MATYEKRVGKSGKTTWRVRVRRQSGHESRSFAKKADAEQWARTVEHSLDRGESLPDSEARRRTLSDAIDKYLKDVLPEAARNKNAPKQKKLLEWWRGELGSRRLSAITPAVVVEARDRLAAKQSRLGKQLAGATVNRHLAALSALFKAAIKEFHWTKTNPVTSVSKRKEAKGRERFLSEPERRALLDACDASPCSALGPIVRLALATGGRRGELLSLQWANVDLERRTLRFLDTKNSESRTVPLAPTAVATLRAWRSGRVPAGVVFPFKVSALEDAWHVARDAAGLGDVRFHDLRHTAASYLAMSGASLMDIAAVLGHRTLSMVKRYSHLSEQHTTAAVDRMAKKFLA